MNKKELVAVDLIRKFNAVHPDVIVEFLERHGGGAYTLRLDYGFTNLDPEIQRKGLKGLNQLLLSINEAGVPAHLELGKVI